MGRQPEVPAEIAHVMQPTVEAILDLIPDVLAIYAYGSRIRGPVHPESDLDIALLPGNRTIRSEILHQLSGDLEARIGYPVELSVLDLHGNVVHCKEAVACGVPIYVADAHAVAVFEMQAFSYYARYCEDRRPVAEAYGEKQLG